MKTFLLPDLGEGLPDAEIVRWYVKEGDKVNIDMPLVAMETAKAIVDVPSPVTGTIKTLFGNVGDVIPTGAALVEFSDAEVPSTSKDKGTVAGTLEVGTTVITQTATKVAQSYSEAKATPAVRALAQRLQVDLSGVISSGPNNTITSKDVENAASKLSLAGELELLKGVRRVMAQNMQAIHAQVVPVSIMDDAIITNFNEDFDITIKIMQALVIACKAEPSLNAWYDGKVLGRRMLKQLDLGIAVDTTEGLFVPVIQNVAAKDTETLRNELNEFKKQAQQRSFKPENLRGASFVLSNFGSMGGRYASPIIMPPSVAILGVGVIRDAVVPIDNKPGIAKLLPLSLTFDHRACTGGEAARFLRTLIAAL